MNKKITKIVVVTSTRADYGLLRPLIQKLQKNKTISCHVAVTGTHLSAEFGNTFDEIQTDKIHKIEKVEIALSNDSPSATSKSLALTNIGFADLYSNNQPDLVILLGDRYEILGAAQTAVIFNIPIAHIHGGEITEGAIDDSFRHAITKMSNYHFTSSEVHRQRVIHLGENPQTVFNVGALAVESINNVKILSKASIEKKLNFKFNKKNFLFCYHPVTKKLLSQKNFLKKILNELLKTDDSNIFISYPNTDTYFLEIVEVLQQFHSKYPDRICLKKSFGHLLYFNIMRNIDIVIGNSSSGIIEAPYFNIPTINIGDRQKNRLASQSVIPCSDSVKSLRQSISKAFSMIRDNNIKHMDKIYGDGLASKKIEKEIYLLLDNLSSQKIFYDVNMENRS